MFFPQWPYLAIGGCGLFLAFIFYCYLRWLKVKGDSTLSYKRCKYSDKIRKTLKADACCICLETFILKEKVAISKCHHVFHSRCLELWLTVKHECPLCKEAFAGQQPLQQQNRSASELQAYQNA